MARCFGWLAIAAALSAFGAAQADSAAPAFAVTLTPIVEVGGLEVAAIDVEIVLGEPPDSPAGPVLGMPHVVSNVDTVALAIDVTAGDARGELALHVADEGDGTAAVRRWRPARPVEGELRLAYRAPISNRAGTRGAAPPLELRSEAGAVSGAGGTFLLLPEGAAPRRITLRWDLAALPSDARAVSSLGVGDLELAEPAPASRMARSFFMAGRVGLHPHEPGERGFFAAWQGEPPFDARAMLEWTDRLHARFSEFFVDAEIPRYAVFMRRNPVNPGGGVALTNSFVATFASNTRPERLKVLMAHEMFHTWAPSIEQPGGLESAWFHEGLAVHYQRVLPWRLGMIDSQAFLDDLNFHAGRYFTNALGDIPNSAVPLRFWEDTRIRTIPYDRGSFYFAAVDHALRQRSQGLRSLDDLLLELLREGQAGRQLSYADWAQWLERELGEAAVSDFRAMLDGAWILPATDAFGPCFQRVPARLRRYELGFEPKVLIEPRRIVRGLLPGSAADRAGLRNGDEILQPVGQDRLQGEQDRDIELQLRRDGRDFVLRYRPRAEEVDAWQWARVPDAPAAACLP